MRHALNDMLGVIVAQNFVCKVGFELRCKGVSSTNVLHCQLGVPPHDETRQSERQRHAATKFHDDSVRALCALCVCSPSQVARCSQKDVLSKLLMVAVPWRMRQHAQLSSLAASTHLRALAAQMPCTESAGAHLAKQLPLHLVFAAHMHMPLPPAG